MSGGWGTGERTRLEVDVAAVYHEVLAFTEHAVNRDRALRDGDEETANREGGAAGDAWRRMQDALGVRRTQEGTDGQG